MVTRYLQCKRFCYKKMKRTNVDSPRLPSLHVLCLILGKQGWVRTLLTSRDIAAPHRAAFRSPSGPHCRIHFTHQVGICRLSLPPVAGKHSGRHPKSQPVWERLGKRNSGLPTGTRSVACRFMFYCRPKFSFP